MSCDHCKRSYRVRSGRSSAPSRDQDAPVRRAPASRAPRIYRLLDAPFRASVRDGGLHQDHSNQRLFRAEKSIDLTFRRRPAPFLPRAIGSAATGQRAESRPRCRRSRELRPAPRSIRLPSPAKAGLIPASGRTLCLSSGPVQRFCKSKAARSFPPRSAREDEMAGKPVAGYAGSDSGVNPPALNPGPIGRLQSISLRRLWPQLCRLCRGCAGYVMAARGPQARRP